MKLPRSPLAPPVLAELPPLAGVRGRAEISGMRYRGRLDLLVMAMAPGTTVAGTLTRSSIPAEPVIWCREHLGRGQARALVVNAGDANVMTGGIGRQVVVRTAETTARLLGCRPEEIFLASTGVIGRHPDPDIMVRTIGRAVPELAPGCWHEASEAIMTTDTFPKRLTAVARIGDRQVTVNGIAKGSGMIAPDMATMLAFVATDAVIGPEVLRELCRGEVARGFNCLTIDGDTSTSDTVLLFATGQAGNPAPSGAGERQLDDFRRALGEVMGGLAELVARDGEGARKLVRIFVRGAESDASARKIGLTIGGSPLVKTAIAGADANWGRVIMAIGRSGEPVERERLGLSFGSLPVLEEGELSPRHDEAAVTALLKQPEIDLAVTVGTGPGAARILSCDLTEGYIDINGRYRS